MLESIAVTFRNDTVFNVYLMATMAVMLAPLVFAPIYHRLVNRSSGGTRLMRDNERFQSRGRSLGSAMQNLSGAAKMAHDISAGRYGKSVRSTQNRAYLYMSVWALVSLGMMLLPIVAMSIYPDPARPPGLQATPSNP